MMVQKSLQAHRRKHRLAPEGGALPLSRFLVNYDGCYFSGELVYLIVSDSKGKPPASFDFSGV